MRAPAQELRRWASFRGLWFAAVILAAAVYDLLLLSNGDFRLLEHEHLDGAFNIMLLNLLHGDFTVAREAINFEAFTRDGKTYAYSATRELSDLFLVSGVH